MSMFTALVGSNLCDIYICFGVVDTGQFLPSQINTVDEVFLVFTHHHSGGWYCLGGFGNAGEVLLPQSRQQCGSSYFPGGPLGDTFSALNKSTQHRFASRRNSSPQRETMLCPIGGEVRERGHRRTGWAVRPAGELFRLQEQ